MGELIDPIIKPTQKKCRNNRIMSFDAYAFDQSDKSFVLIANDFKASLLELVSAPDLSLIDRDQKIFLYSRHRNYKKRTDKIFYI